MKRTAATFLLALTWLMSNSGLALAGWNNVFQTCCNSCRSAPSSSSFFAPAPSASCPTISYQQRCYYQPYTAYRQETYYEPVTITQRSYYWEPVTSYRYTSYYDPCTGCCQQVATPYTSYKLRSQCNAVQSYVQRCRMVPYTAYRQSCYLEPTVSYSIPVCPTPCPTSSPPPSAGVIEGGSQMPSGSGGSKPGVIESGGQENLPPQNLPNTSNRNYPPVKQPPTRMERIARIDQTASLQGTVVQDDRITPRGGTKLFFASTEKNSAEYSTGTDPVGRFSVELPPGEWKMYVSGKDGKPVYHSMVSVQPRDRRLVTVVSR